MYQNIYKEDNKIVALDEFKNRHIFDNNENTLDILSTKNNIEVLKNISESYNTSRTKISIKKIINLLVILGLGITNVVIPFNPLVFLLSIISIYGSTNIYLIEKKKYKANVEIKKIIKEQIKKEYKILEKLQTNKIETSIKEETKFEALTPQITDLKNTLELIKEYLLNFKTFNDYRQAKELGSYLEEEGFSDKDIFFIIKIVDNFQEVNEIIEEDQKQKKLIKG